jgi:O-6-methylguanine DNA methyltransferase
MSFTQRIYQLTRQIPRGFVATYGQLAALAGSPRAARAVGMAMKTNPDAPHTPCHRVVAADGSLTGYSAGRGLVTKKALLSQEGVIFHGHRVDLSKSLWHFTSS